MKKCRSISTEAYLLVLFIIVSTVILTACGSSSRSSEKEMYAVAETAADFGMANDAINRSMGTESVVEIDSASVTSESGLLSEAAVQSQSGVRKLIRTVDLTVETTEFDALLEGLTQTVSEAEGYIERSDVSGNSLYSGSGRRYASLTLRIPSDRLDSFISQVETQGNVINKSESTQDVTLNYTDIESRKRTLTVEQERLIELLAEADSVDAVIALESRLSEIRYQLESMESQLRTYDNQVDYSTVRISLNEVTVLTPVAPDSIGVRIRKGFVENINGIAAVATDAFVWFVSHIPSLAVVVVIVAVLFFIIRRIGKACLRKLTGSSK
ncbi:MAG: DUF4349 domain-containing protein [Clostridiales bacterium]|nr:DUF4349 domain-containing protein [Clostridiales bacterium]